MRQTGLVVLVVLSVAVTIAVPSTLGSVAASPCNRINARTAVANSPLGRKMKEFFGEDATSVEWGISYFARKPLAARDATDIVVEFECCTVHSPTSLAILRPNAFPGWYVSYSSWKRIIYGVHIHGSTVVERRPVWKPTDVLCCPTGVTQYWSVHWKRGRWEVHRVPASSF